MSKTIKFNLILDEQPVRSIEQLYKHFNIHDIMSYYRNGLLLKWLQVSGYTKEMENIAAIDPADSDSTIIDKVISALGFDLPAETVQQVSWLFGFEDERRLLLNQFQINDQNRSRIIDDYHQGYTAIKMQIADNPDELPYIKAAMQEIGASYLELFRLDARTFFETFLEDSPLAVFAVLLNERLRDVFISHPYIQTKLPDLSVNDSVLSKIEQHITMKPMHTDQYWDDVVYAPTQVMVISIPFATYVRSNGNKGEQLEFDDVKGKFPLLSGLDYKSNNSTHPLKYMEV